MKNEYLKLKQLGVIILLMFVLLINTKAQYKDFSLSPSGDTLNIMDAKGLKQGKWLNTIPEVRGEPGYEEEGYYKNNEKTGPWRKYNTTGDIIAVENYKHGGKDGVQEYFNFLGNLQRHEEWKGYNPDSPYDTIPVYGQGNNEIINYKIVKANQYSVEHGEWKYFEGGRLTKVENYDRGQLLKDVAKQAPVATAAADKPKEKVKTKEIMEYEKKYSKKKRAQMERDGKTSL
jgi:hypothetical protein